MIWHFWASMANYDFLSANLWRLHRVKGLGLIGVHTWWHTHLSYASKLRDSAYSCTDDSSREVHVCKLEYVL